MPGLMFLDPRSLEQLSWFVNEMLVAIAISITFTNHESCPSERDLRT